MLLPTGADGDVRDDVLHANNDLLRANNDVLRSHDDVLRGDTDGGVLSVVTAVYELLSLVVRQRR
jgi:hypothetical protein